MRHSASISYMFVMKTHILVRNYRYIKVAIGNVSLNYGIMKVQSLHSFPVPLRIIQEIICFGKDTPTNLHENWFILCFVLLGFVSVLYFKLFFLLRKGIILGMCSANGRRRYLVTPHLIG